jgi:hypothetical protein
VTETTPASIRCAGLAVALLAALACQGSPLADARESDALIEKGLSRPSVRQAEVKRLEGVRWPRIGRGGSERGSAVRDLANGRAAL